MTVTREKVGYSNGSSMGINSTCWCKRQDALAQLSVAGPREQWIVIKFFCIKIFLDDGAVKEAN
jgi:hypothetical protein